ncbi:MAG: ABC transporter substrate-binding protein [Candidatus Nanopelagicaceae bacterium]|jgi:ABC-type transport system substrate-binding protein
MKIRNLRMWITQLAVVSLAGTLLVGVPTANAATGAKCKLNTPSSVSHCDSITVALVGKVVSFDPLSTARTTNQNYVTKFLIQGALWRINSSGRPVFDLVASRKVSTNGLVWTIKLKTGLKYSDAVTPVQADDAVYMWELLKKGGVPPVLSAVKNITATDTSTIVITLNTRFDDLPYSLASLYFFMNPRSKAEGNAKYWDNPLSAGPYEIKSWTPGSDEITLKVNPNYWAKPAVDEIKFLAIPDATTRVVALRQGTIDYAFDLPAAVARAQLSDKKTFRGIPVQLQGTFSLDFNLRTMTAGKPWRDAKVRQALSYAIDRERMGNVAFFGDVKPSCTVVWQSSPLATCMRPGGIAQDLDKAKELLAEAGYSKGFDINIMVFTRAGWPDAASLIAADWKKIGVNATVVPQADAVGVAALTSGAYDVEFIGGTGAIPTQLLRTYYGSTGALTVWSGSGSNDALLNKIDASPVSQKKALLAQVELAIWNESAHIPLGQRAVYGATRLPANIFQNVAGNDTYYVKQTPPLR